MRIKKDIFKKFAALRLKQRIAIIALSATVATSAITYTLTRENKPVVDNPNIGYEQVDEDYGKEDTIIDENHDHGDEVVIPSEDIEENQDEVPGYSDENSNIDNENTPDETLEQEKQEEQEEEQEDEDTFDFASIYIQNYTGPSIVDGLKLNGYPCDREFLKQLAQYINDTYFHYDEVYRGTAEQNTRMLNLLRVSPELRDEYVQNILNQQKPSDEEQQKPSDEEQQKPSDEEQQKPNDEEQQKPGNEETHTHAYSSWRSFNDNKEIRTCSCGAKEFRNHSYQAQENNYTYKSNNQHIVTEIEKCSTCNHIKTKRSYTENCTPGTWTYNPTTGKDETTCTSCGHEMTKTHEEAHTHAYVEQAPTYTYKSNNQHTKTILEKCSCGTTRTKSTSTENCTPGTWTYNPTTGLDETTCTSCGHEMTKTHEETHTHAYVEQAPTYTINTDGTHTKTIMEKCSCGNSRIKSQETVAHTATTWVYNSTNGNDEKVCECGHIVETRAHIHNEDVFVKDGYTNTESNKHNVVKTYHCNACNQDYEVIITAGVECTPGTWAYSATSNKDVTTCSVCGHSMERAHEHNATEWTYNETTGRDERICACNEVLETRMHIHNEDVFIKDGYTNTVENKHNVVKTYHCNACNQDYEVIITAGVECTPGTWTYNSETGKDETTCSVCGHSMTRDHEHNYEVSGVTTYIHIDGTETHKAITPMKCTTCGDIFNKEETKNCFDPEHPEECQGCGYKKPATHTHVVGTTKIIKETSAGLGDLCYTVETYCNDCGALIKTEKHYHIVGDLLKVDPEDENYYCCKNCDKQFKKAEVQGMSSGYSIVNPNLVIKEEELEEEVFFDDTEETEEIIDENNQNEPEIIEVSEENEEQEETPSVEEESQVEDILQGVQEEIAAAVQQMMEEEQQEETPAVEEEPKQEEPKQEPIKVVEIEEVFEQEEEKGQSRVLEIKKN